MRTAIRLMAVAAAGLLAVQVAVAQAPAGSTGQCKDGSYTSAASKQGACKGHQGIKEWYAAEAPPATTKAPATVAVPAPGPIAAPTASSPKVATPTPAPVAAPSTKASPSAKAAAMPQAAGGGPGMVWVNTESNVYHCYGTTYYGKTKAGSYMSEADAKAKGAHPDHGKPCTK